ncbi:MAG: hypothetical protein BWX89_00833 [candidate division TA06 bacterium ADurb.Bin131]|uniref:Uncharacterized protein n=1 Tax=candidate division TA06 bacterium ADurb.Bin131 TaxID=1852827 RepID=A0A1V6C9Y5_UNCT6|nr:MAG: hypothetical protein BWX89_00833 [candidate division TA06 bacterium ADurb.Bin131]
MIAIESGSFSMFQIVSLVKSRLSCRNFSGILTLAPVAITIFFVSKIFSLTTTAFGSFIFASP